MLLRVKRYEDLLRIFKSATRLPWKQLDEEGLRQFKSGQSPSVHLTAAHTLARTREERSLNLSKPESPLLLPKNHDTDQTTLIGRIINVEKNRVHISLGKGKTLSCTSNETIANALRSKTQKRVILKGWGKREKKTGRFLSFVIKSYAILEELDPETALDKHIQAIDKTLKSNKGKL